ncbi:MAG: MBL fold metallo-hydrolase [Thermoplasmataceae archaeon]
MIDSGFCVVRSGSGGNCTIIWDNNDIITIDFGISGVKLQKKLSELGISERNMSVFVTHEHSDHSSGVKIAAKKLKADIYLREKTAVALEIDKYYRMNGEMTIGNFLIHSYQIPHDAVDPVGYVVEHKGKKISVFSDMGHFPDSLLEPLQNSDILALESNHDLEMLKNGTYHEKLKKRVMGPYGHLSNEQAGDALSRLSSPKTKIILLHLSRENNRPELALSNAKDCLHNRGIKYNSIECALQNDGSSVYKLK